jgi:predicted nuclease of predicted toxin-antitoxin system
MKFKVDEHLPIEIAVLLHDAGHDATTVWSEQLAGTDDSTLASVCQQEERILVTMDVGFADIRTYPPQNYSGLIVLRLKQQDKLYVLNVFTRILQLFATTPLEQRLWIVEEELVRVRE